MIRKFRNISKLKYFLVSSFSRVFVIVLGSKFSFRIQVGANFVFKTLFLIGKGCKCSYFLLLYVIEGFRKLGAWFISGVIQFFDFEIITLARGKGLIRINTFLDEIWNECRDDYLYNIWYFLSESWLVHRGQ